MTTAFITIQNPDPAGLVLLVVGLAVLWVAVTLMQKYDDSREEPSPLALKRCQSCGAQIDLINGEWEHVDNNALLVLRAGRHIPEPLTGVH